ncbi:MAG: DUF3800 domain-containing protein [Gammaproteobacteria bacterium]|nr:DUF3800 domain-containing protein [Gammaproteobacteria bacterium]
MPEHLIIYLDESGDLGFDFNNSKTSQYLVIALLVCYDDEASDNTMRAVRKTLKTKVSKNTHELKGSFLALPIKKYFLDQMKKCSGWYLSAAIADKKSWLRNHRANHNHEPKKKVLYDEIAMSVFSQITDIDTALYIDIVIDKSKNKDEINEFDAAVKAAIEARIGRKATLTIRHRSSHEELGLQAVDVFCSGLGRKYEKSDLTWYTEFSDKIQSETIYKSQK